MLGGLKACSRRWRELLTLAHEWHILRGKIYRLGLLCRHLRISESIAEDHRTDRKAIAVITVNEKRDYHSTEALAVAQDDAQFVFRSGRQINLRFIMTRQVPSLGYSTRYPARSRRATSKVAEARSDGVILVVRHTQNPYVRLQVSS